MAHQVVVLTLYIDIKPFFWKAQSISLEMHYWDFKQVDTA